MKLLAQRWLDRAEDEGHAAMAVTCCGKEMEGRSSRLDVCSVCGFTITRDELLAAHGLVGVAIFGWVKQLAGDRRD